MDYYQFLENNKELISKFHWNKWKGNISKFIESLTKLFHFRCWGKEKCFMGRHFLEHYSLYWSLSWSKQ